MNNTMTTETIELTQKENALLSAIQNERVFTFERETAEGTVEVEVKIDFPVPSKGSLVNIYGHEFTVEDVKIVIEYDFDEKLKTYVSRPKMTNEPEPRIVFGIKVKGSKWFDYTWRKGEHFESAE